MEYDVFNDRGIKLLKELKNVESKVVMKFAERAK